VLSAKGMRTLFGSFFFHLFQSFQLWLVLDEIIKPPWARGFCVQSKSPGPLLPSVCSADWNTTMQGEKVKQLPSRLRLSSSRHQHSGKEGLGPYLHSKASKRTRVHAWINPSIKHVLKNNTVAHLALPQELLFKNDIVARLARPQEQHSGPPGK